ncbi:MAG: T9SS type A sorting domain-containing protein, partial [Bacteroidia bacterium]|nr:T9SS type A sorting domain-containing protein [Bacteroidia bacterium]
VTYKFTSSGEEKWVRTISSLPYWTYANTLTLGSDGYLYVTGVDSIGQLTEGGNIITVKYDLNGNEQWIHRYGPENSLIWPQKITVDVSGSVYACGYFQDENGRTDYFTIKYRQSPSTKEEDEINNSADADILRIAPNPFITTTNISFELKKNTKVEIGLYNMQGQLVRMLAKGERPAGRYSEFWNGKDDRNKDVSQGIYFIKLRTSEGLSEVRKIVLLK